MGLMSVPPAETVSAGRRIKPQEAEILVFRSVDVSDDGVTALVTLVKGDVAINEEIEVPWPAVQAQLVSAFRDAGPDDVLAASMVKDGRRYILAPLSKDQAAKLTKLGVV